MAGVFLNIPFGIVEDRMNIKRVLQIVLLVYSGLALLYPMADSFPLLLLVSTARGIASSLLVSIASVRKILFHMKEIPVP